MGQIGKPRDDLLVRAALHPPRPIGVVRGRLDSQGPPFRKPEIKHIVPFLTILENDQMCLLAVCGDAASLHRRRTHPAFASIGLGARVTRRCNGIRIPRV